MRRTHLGVQTAIVLAMLALVSWPQFRTAQPGSIWRYAPDAVLLARANEAAQYSNASFEAARAAAMRATPLTYTAASGGTSAETFAEPGNKTPFYAAVAAAGGKLNALLGFARTALNAPIPYARLALRDIRTGQIVARVTADEHGQFSFLDLDASSYIVELIGADGSVLAASPMVSMLVGDVRRTEIRTAAAATTVSTSLGDKLTATAPQATATAADSGVTRTSADQTPQESTRH